MAKREEKRCSLNFAPYLTPSENAHLVAFSNGGKGTLFLGDARSKLKK